MRFKNLKLSGIIVVSMFMITYPLLKAFTSEGDKVMIFLDALTITSVIMIGVGVLYNSYLKGDFDTTGFLVARNLGKKNIDYNTYISNKRTEKEDSFNYPLFLGIAYFLIALAASYIFY